MRFITVIRRMFLVAMAMCAVCMMAAMADTADFTFTLNTSGDGYVLSGYNGNDASVTVPDWYNRLPVTEISSGAFQGNTAVKTISLPSTIVRIGSDAFKNCTSLSKITSYTAAAEPPRIPGDVDDNGRVDANDALLILQYDAGWNVSLKQDNADVTGNGAIDAEDALLIFRHAAGENVTLN